MSRHRRQQLRRQRRQTAGHSALPDSLWHFWCHRTNRAMMFDWYGCCAGCGDSLTALAAAMRVRRMRLHARVRS